METLLSLQDEILENIKKAERNYKKTPKDRIKRPYLEIRLEVLEQQYKDFKEGHKSIVSKASKDRKEAYFTESKYEYFEEIYIQYKTSLREALLQFTPPSSTEQPLQSNSANNNNNDVKLPRVQLPTFGGKYEEWQTFYDMFCSLIHYNKNITSVQKMHYLKCNLNGEALNLLRNFSTTDANYEEAWSQLVRRYNNKRYNCNAIMKTLFAIKKINSESGNAIKLLLDTTSSCLKSLQNMGVHTETWDAIIIYLVVSKLDTESIKQWEQQLNAMSDELPTWTQLREYLECRFRSLEIIDSTVVRNAQQVTKPALKSKTFHTSIENKSKPKEIECAMCQEAHYIHHCKRFGLMTPKERQDFVQNNKLCFNCLAPTHPAIRCRVSMSCRKCRRRHHTMLHFERESNQESIPSRSEQSASAESPSVHQSTSTTHGDTTVTTAFSRGELQPNSVLLATALVKVCQSNGCKQLVRALLDQGSQASFITESSVQLLGLTRKPISGWVSGLGDERKRIKHTVSLCLESRHNSANRVTIHAYVLKSLTSLLPTTNLRTPKWSDVDNLNLADPTYSVPGKIDVLLGAEVYSEILLEGLTKHAEGSLIAQNTIFGWIISGKVSNLPDTSSKNNLISMHVKVNEDDLLKRFWEMENEPNLIQRRMNASEKACEDIFYETTTRDNEGRFIVKLPFTTDNPKCQYGNSREKAIKRLEYLERKLTKDVELRENYNRVIEEYLSMNHMRRVTEQELQNCRAVYLPHHAVVREDKDTTKVRVVFDASCKDNNNVSLNDELLIGPRLQQDLRHILMRWRSHKICIVADIIKMYRMVRVADEDTDYQRIVWRFHPSDPLGHYKLLRLTFGTACAPYLAVKVLQRLAELEEEKYPMAARVTRRDMYIDDVISGACNTNDAIQIYNEMNELMRAGGFELQKWSSNDETFLRHIGKNEVTEQAATIKLNDVIKVLGLSWNRKEDEFEYVLHLAEIQPIVTKRQVLSEVAKLYDPLGWIAPVVVNAKIFIQSLWKSGLDWDEHLTPDLLTQWLNFRQNLVDLKEVKVPRWLNVSRESRVELHAYSDASRQAYAAAVYMRVIDEKNQVHTHLVTAKTKVAPIEKEVTIPRLELCGATLAAKLIFEVSQIMEIPKENLYCWTDSTVVLAWLKKGSSCWTTFVSNRVATILTILDYEQWSHVSTETNPADCASRGLQPRELIEHAMWWRGPQWLANAGIRKDDTEIEDTHEEERVKSLTVLSNVDENFVWEKFSSLTKLLKVISYCKRFLKCKLKKSERPILPKFITQNEMDDTLHACIKQVQEREFTSEIKQLKKEGFVAKKSTLRTLSPFLDEKGLLRVGGRIQHSDAHYDTRHPIIMPAKNHLTEVIISYAHSQTMHGGPQIMLNFLRTKYWIIRAKERVKKIFRSCTTCLRYSTRKSNPYMGLLPEARVKPSKPFKSTGVDYCGPIYIRFSPGRGAKSYKGYISVFVCMVTRAVHLEAVTDLTAKGFIAAFRRFTSRRGHCSDLYSDNGTNFVGADKQLREMFDRAKSSLTGEIAELLTLERTSWHYIPPHSPNFGGLWESAVRSTKNHLRKVVENSTLTYEEISTVLAQVEACLNSRPISLLSDSPDDPLPLTPGHFLIGEPLINIADENCNNHTVVGLDRWRLTQKIVNDFWNRWHKEYLVNLNQRYKWNTKGAEPEIGDIVIIREENIPPAKWLLGKIIQKYPGPDNITRVVLIKCKSGELKRPVGKICVLPK